MLLFHYNTLRVRARAQNGRGCACAGEQHIPTGLQHIPTGLQHIPTASRKVLVICWNVSSSCWNVSSACACTSMRRVQQADDVFERMNMFILSKLLETAHARARAILRNEQSLIHMSISTTTLCARTENIKLINSIKILILE